MNNSIFTKVLALVLCFIMLAGTLTACLPTVEFNPSNGTTTENGGKEESSTTSGGETTTTPPETTTSTSDGATDNPPEGPEEDPEEDPVDPNELYSGQTTLESDSLVYGTLANDVFIGDESVAAMIPADVKVEAGATALELSIKNVEEATAVDGEALSNLDVHISGIALDNTVPMTVMLGAILPIGLANTELKLYHVEDGTPVLMTRVASAADFAIHNQYVYDAETGVVTIYVASFSVFTAVQTTADVWDGTSADAFASGTGTEEDPYVINTAKQLAYFRDQVDSGRTFQGEFVKLNADIDLADILFDPIGYGYTYNKESDTAFMGTFDGGNHTIYNLYQNGWDLDPDKTNYSTYTYSTAGGGLFASIEGTEESPVVIKNLAVSGADIVFECIDMGIVVGYAQGRCHFENIVVTDSKIANYNRATGAVVGEVCYGSYGTDVTKGYSHTFKNITVDSSVVVSSLWGSFDTLCGGVIGGKWGDATVKMTNVNVAAELDVFSDVTAAYQWYAYRRCGMLIGHTEQNSPRSALNADAPFLTCENVNVYYGDWVNYTYYEFENQDSSTGKRYPWVRAEEGLNNGAFSNPRYGVPTHTVDGVTIKVTELSQTELDKVATDYTPIVFNQLYGGGQGVYGKNDHDGVTIHEKLTKTIYINNNLGWTDPKLNYWFANGNDRWSTVVEGMGITEVANGIYKVVLPAYADGFKIVGNLRNVTTFSTPEILLSAVEEKSTYPLTAFNLTLSIDGKTFDVLTGDWLYNTQVNTTNVPKAEDYDVIIYDKNYTGTFTTNGYGAAIVLDANGKLIKIYDGANGGYYTETGKAASAHFTTSDYATVAWSELEAGQTLLIFPHNTTGDVSRTWALALRNLSEGTGSMGEILTTTTTINPNVHICSNMCLTCFGCRNTACEHADCKNNRCDCLDIYIDVNIDDFDNTLVVTGNNWLYNTQVNTNNYPYASHYQVIIYDQTYDYASASFTTNEFGIAVVLDADNKIVKIYDAANGDRSVVYYDANGSEVIIEAGTGNANGTYATLAWSELKDGEKLAIFPNHKSDNSARNWAKKLCENWASGLDGATAIITATFKLPTTIYFQNTQNWTNVGIKYWYEDGTELTGVLVKTGNDGLHDVYRVVLPANVVKVAFGEATIDGDNVTMTTTTPEITSLQNGYIYVVNGSKVNSTLYKEGYKTIYFQNNWNWKNPSVYSYYTGANGTWDLVGFPGSLMQLHKSKTDKDGDGTYDIYKIVIPAYATAIVFSDGTKFEVEGHQQSRDLTYEKTQDGYIYSMLWDGEDGDKKDDLTSAKYVSGYKTIYFQNNWKWGTPQYNYMGVTLNMKKETTAGTIDTYSFNLPNFATEFKVLGGGEESIKISNSSVTSGKTYSMYYESNQKKFVESVKIYLKPNTNWKSDSAWFAARIWDSNGDAWFKMTADGSTGYYYCYIPKGYTNVIFCRMNSSASSTSTSSYDWGKVWNQTSDLTISGGKNCYTVSEGAWSKGSGSWSTR